MTTNTRDDAAHPSGTARGLVTTIAVVQLLAVAFWAGGLITLGAIVAPIVFRIVHAPASADAMTLVFGRFDTVAITCAVIALVAEAAFAFRGGRVTRTDLARAACLVVATVLAIVIGAWLSPGITELHRSGAIRGLDASGLALERLHHLAETLAKTELVLLLGVFILSVAKAARGTPPARSPSEPRP
jgi:hypothetical protein